MKKKRKRQRFVSVMEIQRLPPEKVVELFEQLNRGEVVLVSIYPDRWAQIGLKSPTLENFVQKTQGLATPYITKIMRTLSKEWFNENETTISGRAKQKNSKTLQILQKTGLYCEKVL